MKPARLLFVVAICLQPVDSAGQPSPKVSPAREKIRAAILRRHAATAERSEAARGTEGATSAAHSVTRGAILRRHGVTGDGSAPASAAPPAGDVAGDLQAGNQRFASRAHRASGAGGGGPASPDRAHPRAAVLGCSGARVGPADIFDSRRGDLFVVRTAGDVADSAAVASLEYAVAKLEVKVVVVLGHEHCGVIAAALQSETMPGNALSALVAKITPTLAPLRARASGDELARLAVRAHVRRVAKNLAAKSSLLRRSLASGELEIIEAVYDRDNRKVTFLQPAAPPTREEVNARVDDSGKGKSR